MSSISINCSVSLSKKLRALLKKEEACSLILVADIKDGKGLGKLSFDSEVFTDVPNDILDLGETSIQITPSTLADETPTSDSVSQAAIFSTLPSKGESSPVVSKIAAVHAPEKGEEAHAVVSKENVKTPDAFKEIDDLECRKWISNMEELLEEVNKAKSKKSDVDLDMAQTDRERAVLMELKAKDEAIDAPAWIVNDKNGSITVNDLDITLLQNAPFDLSNISARRILMSRDLKGLIKTGLVRFLSPSERDTYIIGSNNGDEIDHGLEVFSKVEEAEAHMANSVAANPIIDEENAIEVTESDVDALTEQESMIMNLTQALPVTKRTVPSEHREPQEPRHSVHGKQSRPSPNPEAKSPNIKPIRKLS